MFKHLVHTIGTNIRLIRTEKAIPLKLLASKLGISPQQLSNIENGKTEDVGIKRITEIAYFIGVDVNTLLHYNASTSTVKCFDNTMKNQQFSVAAPSQTIPAEEILEQISLIIQTRSK